MNPSTLLPTCVCTFPFASIGDFATDPGVDCSINLPATQSLWAICAFFNFALFAYTIRAFVFGAKRLNLVERNLILGCSIFSSLFVVIGLLEATANSPGERSIGIDPVTTFLFAFGSSIFWAMMNYYNSIVIQMSLKQCRMFSDGVLQVQIKAMKIVRFYLPLYLVLSVAACLVVIGFLTNPIYYDQLFASLHYLVLGSAIGINLIVTTAAINPLVFQIQQTMKNLPPESSSLPKLKKVLDIFLANRKRLFNNSIFSVVFAILFGAVPILTRKSAYWLPIAWSSAAVACLETVMIIGSNSTRQNDSSLVPSSGGRVVNTTTSFKKEGTEITQTEYNKV